MNKLSRTSMKLGMFLIKKIPEDIGDKILTAIEEKNKEKDAIMQLQEKYNELCQEMAILGSISNEVASYQNKIMLKEQENHCLIETIKEFCEDAKKEEKNISIKSQKLKILNENIIAIKVNNSKLRCELQRIHKNSQKFLKKREDVTEMNKLWLKKYEERLQLQRQFSLVKLVSHKSCCECIII